MAKKSLRPATVILPVPVGLITCQSRTGSSNIITLAWVGVVNSEPPMVGISIRPGRFSYGIIKESGEFTVNIPGEDQLKAADYCGVVSGRNHDKFQATGLTPHPSEKIKPPFIGECPINLECVVKETIPLGSHDLFIGEIITLHVDDTVTRKDGSIDVQKILPLAYCPGAREYWKLGELLGVHGFTEGKI